MPLPGHTLQNRLVFFSRKPVSAICSCRGSTVCSTGAVRWPGFSRSIRVLW